MKTQQDFLDKKFSDRKTTEEWVTRLNKCKDPDEFDGLLFHAFDGREGDPDVARVLLHIAGATSTNEVQTMHCRTARAILVTKFLKPPERDPHQRFDSDPPWFSAVRKDPPLLKVLVNTLSEMYESRLPSSHRRTVEEFVELCASYHRNVEGAIDKEMMAIVNEAMFEIVQMVFACELDIGFSLQATVPEERHWEDRHHAVSGALERLVFSDKPVTKEMRATLVDPEYDQQMSNVLLKFYVRRAWVLKNTLEQCAKELPGVARMEYNNGKRLSEIITSLKIGGQEVDIKKLEDELAQLPNFH